MSLGWPVREELNPSSCSGHLPPFYEVYQSPSARLKYAAGGRTSHTGSHTNDEQNAGLLKATTRY